MKITEKKKETGVSIVEIKSDFEVEGEIFEDADLEKIRDFLYLLAQIGFEHLERQKRKEEIENSKVINIKNYQQDESTESNIVYPCEYRRTG